MAPNQNKKRVNFASIKNPLQFPDFLEVQLKSFQDFFQLDTPPERRKMEGLYKVFAENFPIADTRNNFVLEFLDYRSEVFVIRVSTVKLKFRFKRNTISKTTT